MWKLLAVSFLFLVVACSESQPKQEVGISAGGPQRTGIRPGDPSYVVGLLYDRVLFADDSVALTLRGRQILACLAEWFASAPQAGILIEGHADERGPRDYNLALGDRRAQAVRDYMIALGISSARISTISYGKEMPAVLGHDERSWAQNRRAVVSSVQAGRRGPPGRIVPEFATNCPMLEPRSDGHSLE